MIAKETVCIKVLQGSIISMPLSHIAPSHLSRQLFCSGDITACSKNRNEMKILKKN